MNLTNSSILISTVVILSSCGTPNNSVKGSKELSFNSLKRSEALLGEPTEIWHEFSCRGKTNKKVSAKYRYSTSILQTLNMSYQTELNTEKFTKEMLTGGIYKNFDGQSIVFITARSQNDFFDLSLTRNWEQGDESFYGVLRVKDEPDSKSNPYLVICEFSTNEKGP